MRRSNSSSRDRGAGRPDERKRPHGFALYDREGGGICVFIEALKKVRVGKTGVSDILYRQNVPGQMMHARHAQTGAVMKIEENTNDYLPLRDVVFNTLRKHSEGEMKPGEGWMEIHLANKLGVSRTPIREAIRKLELEGLVTMIPRRGAEVAQITAKGLRDVLEVRQALDALAMELAL